MNVGYHFTGKTPGVFYESDRHKVGWLKRTGEGHRTKRCRRVPYPESNITKYTMNINIITPLAGGLFRGGDIAGEYDVNPKPLTPNPHP